MVERYREFIISPERKDEIMFNNYTTSISVVGISNRFRLIINENPTTITSINGKINIEDILRTEPYYKYIEKISRDEHYNKLSDMDKKRTINFNSIEDSYIEFIDDLGDNANFKILQYYIDTNV